MVVCLDSVVEVTIPASSIERIRFESGTIVELRQRRPSNISDFINDVSHARVGRKLHIVGGFAVFSSEKKWERLASDSILLPFENSVVALDSNDSVPQVASAPYTDCPERVVEVDDNENPSHLKTATKNRNRNRNLQVSDDFSGLPISEIIELISPFLGAVFPERGSSK